MKVFPEAAQSWRSVFRSMMVVRSEQLTPDHVLFNTEFTCKLKTDRKLMNSENGTNYFIIKTDRGPHEVKLTAEHHASSVTS